MLINFNAFFLVSNLDPNVMIFASLCNLDNLVDFSLKHWAAAQCFNEKSTKLSRLHNDANIITLGSRLLTKKNALKFISIFLNTKFEGGRHLKRVKKI